MVKLKADGHRVLIYSQFTRMLDILEDWIHDKVGIFFLMTMCVYVCVYVSVCLSSLSFWNSGITAGLWFLRKQVCGKEGFRQTFVFLSFSRNGVMSGLMARLMVWSGKYESIASTHPLQLNSVSCCQHVREAWASILLLQTLWSSMTGTYMSHVLTSCHDDDDYDDK